MGLIKLATNFKQFIRPIQRNKIFFGATTGIGAGLGALIGNSTKYETDAYGTIKKDKHGNNKIKPGASGFKRALVGAGIGAGIAGLTAAPVIHDVDIIKLRGAKFSRNTKNAHRRFKADFERRRKRFEEDLKRETEYSYNSFGSGKKNQPFPDDDFFDQFFGKSGKESKYKYNDYEYHRNKSSYTQPPPPPPRPRQNDFHSSDNIGKFFKEHTDIDHTKIKTKAEAKKAYRKAAAKYHPDTTPHPHMKDGNHFKKFQGDWDQIEQSPWFEKLGSMRDLLRSLNI